MPQTLVVRKKSFVQTVARGCFSHFRRVQPSKRERLSDCALKLQDAAFTHKANGVAWYNTNRIHKKFSSSVDKKQDIFSLCPKSQNSLKKPKGNTTGISYSRRLNGCTAGCRFGFKLWISTLDSEFGSEFHFVIPYIGLWYLLRFVPPKKKTAKTLFVPIRSLPDDRAR